MIIYADELLLKNLLMSYLILVVTGEILLIRYKKRNLLLGSFVASIITLFCVIYDVQNYMMCRILTIMIMTVISYESNSLKTYFTEAIFILGVTFFLGGLLKSNLKSMYEIIFCGIASMIGIKKYSEYYKIKKWIARNSYKLEFNLVGVDIELNAFLDTGNLLSSSYANDSVIIISKEALVNKIPIEIIDALQNENIDNLKFNILKNIRPIKYNVLNEEPKVTYGLKVKNIKIISENINIIKDAVIVLSKNKIKESDAIIGINLLEGGFENGNTSYAKTKSKEIIC